MCRPAQAAADSTWADETKKLEKSRKGYTKGNVVSNNFVKLDLRKKARRFCGTGNTRGKGFRSGKFSKYDRSKVYRARAVASIESADMSSMLPLRRWL